MRPKRAVAAAVAAVTLAWGSAQAAPETEATPELPGVIILELVPRGPGEEAMAGSDQEQNLLGLLLLQLLGAIPGGGAGTGDVDVQLVAPPVGTRI